jgi:DeoR/GlpR family transcriptional regulator of sugar metabolism
MKQSILASTKKKIVLADSSKIDVVFTSKICEFTDIDTLITDSKIDQKTIKDLRKTGIEVRTA